MLDLLKLRTFRTVALTKNFTRAAAQLGYSQSNVTTHIKALEQELGAPLFDRFRFANRIVLTEAGRRTLEYAGRLLALADETKAALQKGGEPGGPLRVSAPEALLSYRLPELVHRFQIRYPKVKLSLASSADRASQTTAVLDGEVDLVFLVDEPVKPGRLIVQRLTQEELVLVAAPGNRWADRENPLADILKTEDLLTEPSGAHRLLIERVLSASEIRRANLIEMGSMEAVKRCAAGGLGVAVVPRAATALELEQGRLIPLRWRSGQKSNQAIAPNLYTQMLRSSERWMSPAVNALWNLALEGFAAD